jgi:hypothetical protein
MVPQVKKKLFGLITRKERWGLSARGWLCLMALILSVGLGWAFNVHPFLAQTKRVDTKVLVVEGWIRQFALKAAVVEIQSGRYQKVYTRGDERLQHGGKRRSGMAGESRGAGGPGADGAVACRGTRPHL